MAELNRISAYYYLCEWWKDELGNLASGAHKCSDKRDSHWPPWLMIFQSSSVALEVGGPQICVQAIIGIEEMANQRNERTPT